MKKNTYITILICIIAIMLVMYLSEERTNQKALEVGNSGMYSFGSINPNFGGDQTLGCTDQTAQNYNSLATTDDGSCLYQIGCCDVNATNYDPSSDSCNVPGNDELICNYDAGRTSFRDYMVYSFLNS